METEVCKKCGGAGKIYYLVKHALTGKDKVAIQWCICSKSKFVSESPNHKILAGLGDAYLEYKDIDPQLKFYPDNLAMSPNYVIEAGTDSDSFRFHIKGIIMKYGFSAPAPLFLCCDAMEILKRFYVAQGDGSCPSLIDINKYALLVVALGTSEKNDQLKTCISQVVYNRLSIKKPTWIYFRVPYGLCVQEQSAELEEHMKKFEKITLTNTHMETPIVVSKTKDLAEDFKL